MGNPNKMVNLANSLSLEEMCKLINMFASDIQVYLGSLNGYAISDSVVWACLNGHSIQINTEKTELDDLTDDPFIRDAINSLAPDTDCALLHKQAE